MRSGESSTPAARWKRVAAAGMNPDESAVEPEGEASLSSTSTRAFFAASAATKPHAPAPITTTGIFKRWRP